MSEQHEGARRMDRIIGMQIANAGWRIIRLELDQDRTYVDSGVVGVWTCELDTNPFRRSRHRPRIVRGSGLTSQQAIEDAYNRARESVEGAS